jgi:hypothetical protein
MGLFMLTLDDEPIAFSESPMALLFAYGMHTGQPVLANAS